MSRGGRNNTYVTKIRSERSTATSLGMFCLVVGGVFFVGWLAVKHIPAVGEAYARMTGSTGTAGVAGAPAKVGKKVGGMWKGVGK